jgi:hypothetical protein
MDSPNDAVVRRAALPELMFAADIGVAVDLPVDVVEAQAPTGCFGPVLYVNGRVAVLRQDFLETMTLRASRRDRGQKEVLPRNTRGGS